MHVGCIYCVIVLFLEEKSCKILVRKLRQKGKIQTKSQLEQENIWLIENAWCSIGFYLPINQCTQIKSKGLILSFVVCCFKDWTWKVHSLLKEIKKTSADLLISKELIVGITAVGQWFCANVRHCRFGTLLRLALSPIGTKIRSIRTGYYETVNET